MKAYKKFIIISIVILLLVVAGLIGVMIVGMNTNWLDNRVGRNDSDGWYSAENISSESEGEGPVDLRRVLEIPAAEVKDFEIKTTSVKIELVESGSDVIRIEEYGPDSVDEDELFVYQQSGSILRIEEPTKFRLFHFSIFEGERKIIIYASLEGLESFKGTSTSGSDTVPNLNMEDVTLKSVSGKINAGDLTATSQAVVSTTSGSIKAGAIESKWVEVDSVSGSIEVQAVLGDHKVGSTSGKISLDGLDGAGSVSSVSGSVILDHYNGGGKISTTSGSIHLVLEGMKDDLDIHSVSGSCNISVTNDVSFSLDIKTTSGRVTTNFLGFDVDKKITNYQHGENPEHKLSISTTSGGITLE